MKKLLAMTAILVFFISACDSGIKVNTQEEPGTSSSSATPEPAPAPATNDPEDDPPPPEMEELLVAIGWNDADPIASVNTLTLDGTDTLGQNIAVTNGSDAHLRTDGTYVYVVNRWGADSIQVMDPKDGFKIIGDYSVGALTNPQDMVFVGDSAYISRLQPEADATDSSDVIKVNPLTGERLKGFDLKGYMTADGEQLAFAAQMAVAGKYIYVTCQDLSSWWAADTNGKVAVNDTETDTVIASIALTGRNPGDIFYSEATGKLYVTDTGVYDWFTMKTDINDAFGGIEVIDAATNTAEGIKIDDKELGDAPSEIRIAGGKGYVIAGSTLLGFDPETYSVTNTNVYTSPFRWMPEMEITRDGTIAVTERSTTGAGIVFVNPDGTVQKGPVSIGSTPYSIEVIEIEKSAGTVEKNKLQ